MKTPNAQSTVIDWAFFSGVLAAVRLVIVIVQPISEQRHDYSDGNRGNQ